MASRPRLGRRVAGASFRPGSMAHSCPSRRKSTTSLRRLQRLSTRGRCSTRSRRACRSRRASSSPEPGSASTTKRWPLSRMNATPRRARCCASARPRFSRACPSRGFAPTCSGSSPRAPTTRKSSSRIPSRGPIRSRTVPCCSMRSSGHSCATWCCRTTPPARSRSGRSSPTRLTRSTSPRSSRFSRR